MTKIGIYKSLELFSYKQRGIANYQCLMIPPAPLLSRHSFIQQWANQLHGASS